MSRNSAPLDYGTQQPRPSLMALPLLFVVYAASVILGFLLEEAAMVRLIGHPGDSGVQFLHVLGAVVDGLILIALYGQCLRGLHLGWRVAVAALGGLLAFPVGLGIFYAVSGLFTLLV